MRTETEAETHIRLKVREDPDFRMRLIQDPKAAVLTETGIDLSDDELAFVNAEIRKGIVEWAGADEPLSEEELKEVAGGTWGVGMEITSKY